MPKDITAILKEATKDLLTEQTLSDIKTAFDAAVNATADERAKLQVESALEKQDSEYSGKLEKLLAAIDADHASKLMRVVEAIDTDHSGKLKKVIALYEKALTRDANEFKADLVNKLDRYLDLYLEEKLPTATITQAVDNVRSAKLVSQMRTMLGVDMAMATESIRAAVLDGKAQLDDYKAALETANKKINTLTESVEKTSAELLIEKSIAELPTEKKQYAKKMLAGKDATYIKENFNYILDMFDKNEAEQLDVLKEEAATTTHALTVDRPIVENVTSQEETANVDPQLNSYLTELKKV